MHDLFTEFEKRSILKKLGNICEFLLNLIVVYPVDYKGYYQTIFQVWALAHTILYCIVNCIQIQLMVGPPNFLLIFSNFLGFFESGSERSWHHGS
jgi:hypothetical protein